ncbi:transcription repressor OFP15-like [Salvia splendens]|uniref:transcription repressor OFP15-like n=1 Tax=Salvia splendens TaxID=180675 RepID=UPI001C253BD1|nr:transcription repressor OFP15-like [Salvia splendens]
MSNKNASPFSPSPWPWPACVNNSPKTLSFRANDDESAVIGALRSDRLFFDPGETRSILEDSRHGVKITAIDSYDPFLDFRSSMAEMVAAHGLNSLDFEELLACYLRLNDRSNHGYIVAAYVDLLINHHHCSSSAHYSFTSPLSFSSSSSTGYSEHQIAAGLSEFFPMKM